MIINKIACVVFSPTGGCYKVASRIRELFTSHDISIINITNQVNRENTIKSLGDFNYLIIIVPVYADTMPDCVNKYLKNSTISGKAISIISCFGNINIGTILKDIERLLIRKNNYIISACNIVVAHSYNNNQIKIAESEPSDSKLEYIVNFIKASVSKIEKSDSLESLKVNLPKSNRRLMCYVPQKILPHIFIKKSKVDIDICSKCGVCINVCPTLSIQKDLRTYP